MRSFELLEEKAVMPKRATVNSAGYDFYSTDNVTIMIGEIKAVSTGVTAKMMENEFLMLSIRSGLALKYGLTLQNGIGIVDSDYYPNEIKFIVSNEGESPVNIYKGDRIGQGVFVEFKKVDEEEGVERIRESGFGHTGIVD